MSGLKSLSVMDARITITVATLAFLLLLGFGYAKNREEGIKSIAFGFRWAIVGIYVALMQVAMQNFNSGFWQFMAFALAVVALGFIDLGLKRMVALHRH